MAYALRRLRQGIKVAAEIVMMACDAGLIPEGKKVVTMAGTGRGADTGAVILSAATRSFSNLRMLEILAKPRE